MGGGGGVVVKESCLQVDILHHSEGCALCVDFGHTARAQHVHHPKKKRSTLHSIHNKHLVSQ